MRVELGYKFTIGFIMVIGAVAFVPYVTKFINLPEGLEDVVSTLVAIIVGLSAGLSLSKSFSRNFEDLTSAADSISKGNLKPRKILTHEMKFEDETVDLEISIQKMMSSLRELVIHVQENSGSVSEAAHSLSSTAQEMNASTEEISSTIEQIAKGAELQTEMVENVGAY